MKYIATTCRAAPRIPPRASGGRDGQKWRRLQENDGRLSRPVLGEREGETHSRHSTQPYFIKGKADFAENEYTSVKFCIPGVLLISD